MSDVGEHPRKRVDFIEELWVDDAIGFDQSSKKLIVDDAFGHGHVLKVSNDIVPGENAWAYLRPKADTIINAEYHGLSELVLLAEASRNRQAQNLLH